LRLGTRIPTRKTISRIWLSWRRWPAPRGSGRLGRRLQFPGLLQSAYVTQGAEVVGVDPEGELVLSRIPAKVAEGRWLQGSGEVVLGEEVARRIDARVGERIVISAASLAGPQGDGP